MQTPVPQAVDTISAWGQVGLAGAIVLVVLSAVAFILKEVVKLRNVVAQQQREVLTAPPRPAGVSADDTGEHLLGGASGPGNAAARRIDVVEEKLDGMGERLATIETDLRWIRRHLGA